MTTGQPVVMMTIAPKNADDHERLWRGLRTLQLEDGAFDAYTDVDGKVCLAGMGELHLEIVVDRLALEFGVETLRGKPQAAYRDGVATDGTPIRLEPFVRVEITVPEEFAAGVLEDLAGRRAEWQAENLRGPSRIIAVRAPMSRMLGYAGDLRKRTRGRGAFSMRLEGFQPPA